ncbi:hypothetical protein [Nitrosophilus kaiyonis]|uniref:hypothetical protein n=1 Tax=Nitrosophilus kaiyonis TaxID=2930200 RepID=UPI00249120B7|nr:hypothetical protein [Nitrosophilus kaiyonis]
MDINKKVLLLAIFKKEENESYKDIILMLENSRVFSLKEGKRLLKELKNEQFLNDNGLTIKGMAKAKEIEEEFKI